MLKAEIIAGQDYAFREKRQRCTPVERVRVVEHIRANKWKVEWVEPNPGLVHYAESAQLVCAWKERKAFLQEEEDQQRIDRYNVEHGYQLKSAITNAIQQVYQAASDGVSFEAGCLRCERGAI